MQDDICPHTNQPYVPLSVLQAAYWNQSTLRHQITATPTHDAEIALAVSTHDLLAKTLALAPPLLSTKELVYPIPVDSYLKLGAGMNIQALSMGQLLTPAMYTTGRKTEANMVTSQSNLFGFKTDRTSASSCADHDLTGKMQWSPYPPYRFAVEFSDVDSLEDMLPHFSQTVCYAGSCFNVYVQLFREDELQLGVYLHRQSPHDHLPNSSHPPFIDFRDRISAHFRIFCSNQTGSTLQRFTCAPEKFSLNQSWGYRLSSRLTHNYLQPSASLRVIVVLGLV